MCGKKLRKSLVSWVLCFLLCCSPFCSSCFAEVVLTDKEATELKNQLSEAETQLNDVKNTYEEQKTYYEQRLKEEKKKSTEAKIFAYSASASTLVVSIVLLIVLL